MDDAPPFIPLRHGQDLAATAAVVRRLRWAIRGDAEAEARRREARIARGLLEGDPLADALVDWMSRRGLSQTFPLVECAAREGLASLERPAPPLRAFFEALETPPAWLDWARLERGAALFQRLGRTAHYVLRDLALMGGYQAAGLNQPLILTGALEGGTSRRIAETMRWVQAVTRSGGLRRGADGYVTTVQVRLIHALIRRRLLQRPDWDTARLGLPINQSDMAATGYAFSALLLLGARAMGVPIGRGEGRDLMHHWRYVNTLVGVDAHWLSDEEQEGRRWLYAFGRYQLPADASSQALARALMDEVLAVPHGWPAALRARFAQARHLSVTRYFIGADGMRRLGLPATTPWFPLLRLPWTFAWHAAAQFVPGGRTLAQRLGAAAQSALVARQFAGRPAAVRSLHAL